MANYFTFCTIDKKAESNHIRCEQNACTSSTPLFDVDSEIKSFAISMIEKSFKRKDTYENLRLRIEGVRIS